MAEDLLAPNAMTTLRKMKTLLGIPQENVEQDEVLADYINGASQFCETYCERKFGKATYTQRIPGTGRLKLVLEHYPIIAVDELTVNEVTLRPDEFDIFSEEGMLYRDRGWPEDSYGTFGLAYEPTDRKLNIRVKYSAGFVLPKDGSAEAPRTLPYDLEQAVIKLVKLLYHDKDGTAGILILKRERLGDWAVEYDVIDKPNDAGKDAVPYDILQVLNYWRRKS